VGGAWSDRVGITLLCVLVALVPTVIVCVAIGAARRRLTRGSYVWAAVTLVGAIAALAFGCVTPVLSDGATCVLPAILELLPDSADAVGRRTVIDLGQPVPVDTCNGYATSHILPALLVMVAGLVGWAVVARAARHRRSGCLAAE
jgi:hypothetical protein